MRMVFIRHVSVTYIRANKARGLNYPILYRISLYGLRSFC